MVIDSNKAVLYSTGDQKLLHGLDLKKQSYYNHLKMSNSQPSELSIDEEANRLYFATRGTAKRLVTYNFGRHTIDRMAR